MTTTSSLSPLMHAGVNQVIDTELLTKVDFAAKLIGREITTTELYHDVVMFTGLGPAADIREATGVPFDSPSTPYRKQFYWGIKAIGAEFTFEAIKTDQWGKLKNFAMMAADSLYLYRQQFFADFLNFASSTAASNLGIDGVPLASASHPTRTGTFSNIMSTAALLAPSVLEDMIKVGDNQKTYRDQPFMYRGGYDLHCHDNQSAIAYRLLNTMNGGQPGGNDNDKSYGQSRISAYCPNPYYTQTNYSMLTPSSKSENPLFILKHGSEGIEIYEDKDISKLVQIYVGVKRYGKGWLRPQGIVVNLAA